MNRWHIYHRQHGFWEKKASFTSIHEAYRFGNREFSLKNKVVVSPIDAAGAKSLPAMKIWDVFGEIPTFVSNRRALKSELVKIRVDKQKKARQTTQDRLKSRRYNEIEHTLGELG